MRATFLLLSLLLLAPPVAAQGPFLGRTRDEDLGMRLRALHQTGTVEIDIQPWDDRNLVLLSDPAPMNVAVMGSARMDVSELDPDSFRFGPAQAAPALPGAVLEEAFRLDVNHDGFEDMVVPFFTEETGLVIEARTGCLSGGGRSTSFSSCGGLTVRFASSCGLGPELVVVLPLLLAWRRRRAGH